MKAGLIGALIAALSVQSGCSFLFVSGPPADHAQMASFECSESNAVPVLDTIWAGLNGLGAITAAGDNTTANQSQIVAVGLSWLAISGAAAIYGYTKVSQCKAARREREERFANSPPPGYMPPPRMAPPPSQVMTAAPGAQDPAPAARPAAPPPPPATSVRAPAAPAVDPAPPGTPAAAPTSSLLPRARSVSPMRPDVRAAPVRSLAMRPALATD